MGARNGRRRAAPLLAVPALLAACTVGPDYHEPEVSVPGQFTELSANGIAARNAELAEWWKTFHDPMLDSLIERAVRANPGLRQAQARVREARARRGVVASDAYPTVDAAGGAARVRTSGNLGDLPAVTSNLFEAGFDALWELDVFGGVRRNVESADAEIAASVEDRRDVLVTLLAEVARTYVELRGAQRQTAIAKQNLAAQSETLDLTRRRLGAGLATDLDVARSEAQVAATGSVIPLFETTVHVSLHALAVLLAQEPNALLDELSADAPIPTAPPELPAGLPSELLRRRPDVRRAERRLAASTARIGVFTADYFPRFSLTGSVGLTSDHAGDFFDAASRRGAVAGAVRWPILDFGRIRSTVDVANAQEEQAAAFYEETVLASLREVEDALVTFAKERSRTALLSTATEASRRAAGLANQLWTAGRTDFLSVLDAQRDLFAAEDALVRSEQRTASNLVAVYKALGGGWEIEAAAGDVPSRGEPGKRTLDLAGPAPAAGAAPPPAKNP